MSQASPRTLTAADPPPAESADSGAASWDLFCKVVDNFGDIGVCWRLACALAQLGRRVRLWVDDDSALSWMAPQGCEGVEVILWREPMDWPAPAEVVVETFGCGLPEGVIDRMLAAARPPLWINLEYLSAEPYVERSHRLRSPQRCGLDAWFFYPGFTPATGGLLHEPGLVQRMQAFHAETWLQQRLGLSRLGDECLVSLFCYPGVDIACLLAALARNIPGRPVGLLTAPGAATEAARSMLSAPGSNPESAPGLRHLPLPWLSQDDYDHLLWSCELNCVRGEDSFVRALWAARPMLWHIYPQDDGAHALKLQAFVERQTAGAPPALAASILAWQQAWNGLGPAPQRLPDLAGWQSQSRLWRDSLLGQDGLARQLLNFAAEKR